MNFLDRLKRLRKASGWKWNQLERELDLSRTMLHYLRAETRQPSERTLFKLEAAETKFGLSPTQKLLNRAAGVAEAEPGTEEDKQVAFNKDLAEQLAERANETREETWRRRALASEKLLAETRQDLRRILNYTAATPIPEENKLSESASEQTKAEVLGHAKDILGKIGRGELGGSRPSGKKSTQPPPASPPTKYPRPSPSKPGRG